MQVKDLLISEDKWCKGCFAKDAFGVVVPPRHYTAACWCLMGALDKCYPRIVDNTEAQNKLLKAISIDSTVAVPTFNDDPATTFADIRSVIEKADI